MKKAIALALVGAMSVGLLAGCGGGSSSSAAASSAASTGAASEAFSGSESDDVRGHLCEEGAGHHG